MIWNIIAMVISGVFAVFSGIFWVLSAQVTVPLLPLHLSHVPEPAGFPSRIQSRYNGVAAWLAAIAAFAQGISTAITIHGLASP